MKPIVKIYAVIGLLAAGSLMCAGVLSGFANAKTANAPLSSGLDGLKKGEAGKVVRVIDGDSFVLESGLKVELAGVQAPKPAWPDKGYDAWPLADEARQALSQIIQGQTVQLYYSGKPRDRYDRALAQVWIDGGEPVWVQEEMIAKGYGRVYTWPKQAQNTARLLTAEDAARSAKIGIWHGATTNGYYDVRSPDPNPLAQYVDSVQIVEGIIISTAKVRDITYLNFGSDYKTDFTAAIGKSAQKYFKAAEYDPLTLTGARVRVRGWIELRNGPMVWLDTPERLEVLD